MFRAKMTALNVAEFHHRSVSMADAEKTTMWRETWKPTVPLRRWEACQARWNCRRRWCNSVVTLSGSVVSAD